MPNRYRFFFLDRDDRLIKVSQKCFVRLYSDDESAAVPELAGQRARSVIAVQVFSETRDPVPVGDPEFIFGIVTFDERGKGDKEESERKRFYAMQALAGEDTSTFKDEYHWQPDAKIMEMLQNAPTVLEMQRLEKRQIDKALDRLENPRPAQQSGRRNTRQARPLQSTEDARLAERQAEMRMRWSQQTASSTERQIDEALERLEEPGLPPEKDSQS